MNAGRPRVLVVEDSPECAATLEVSLGAAFEVVVAADAEQALEMIAATDVAAVVSDVELPGMDGFELVSRLRGDGRHLRTPILMVSASGDGATPRRALAAGANAFIAKPFSPAAVRRAVENLVNET